MYRGITSTKSRSFCTTTFSASLAKLTILLPQWHDCSYELRNQMDNGTCTNLTAETSRPTGDNFSHTPDWWHHPETGEFVKLILLYTIAISFYVIFQAPIQRLLYCSRWWRMQLKTPLNYTWIDQSVKPALCCCQILGRRQATLSSVFRYSGIRRRVPIHLGPGVSRPPRREPIKQRRDVTYPKKANLSHTNEQI